MSISIEARMELGARLNAIRTGLGLSPHIVADGLLGHIGSNHDLVVRIERGATSRLKRETVEKLAALYHVDLDSLLPTGVSLDDFEGPTGALPGLPAAPTRAAPAADGEDRPSTVDQAGGDVPSTQARIRQLRASTGLSASAFAKKLSTKAAPISERDIEDWERARRRPTRDHLDAIELLTGASPGWVMTGRKR